MTFNYKENSYFYNKTFMENNRFNFKKGGYYRNTLTLCLI